MGLPTAWKKLEDVIWNPATKQSARKVRKVLTAKALYRASSWPKMLMTLSGKIINTR